ENRKFIQAPSPEIWSETISGSEGSWRGSGVACFLATSLEKIFGGVIAIISFRPGGWMQQSTVPRCAITPPTISRKKQRVHSGQQYLAPCAVWLFRHRANRKFDLAIDFAVLRLTTNSNLIGASDRASANTAHGRRTMKGVVFLGDRKLELREFPDPTPGSRDVILEIKASGMCGSDLHNYRAPANPGAIATGGIQRAAGVIAGHEPCGIVAAVGTAVTDKEGRIGQRVMDHHYDGCGNCKHCRAGWTQMCLEGTVVYGSGGHGGHAKYMKVPVSTLVPLPDSLSFVTGAAISCGTGTAWGALRRVQLQGGETIAIFGHGAVGLPGTQLAVEMGARVIAIDIAPERRKLAQQFGAAEVIDPTAHDTVAAIRELTHGEGAHKTLDASSAPDARAAAVRSV